MKKSFETIRSDIYSVIAAFQKYANEDSSVDPGDVLAFFVDMIAGLYDMNQYMFDKIVRSYNPVQVLFSKDFSNYGKTSFFTAMYAYKNFKGSPVPPKPSLKELREFYLGTDLDSKDGQLSEYFNYWSCSGFPGDITSISLSTLLRALFEALFVVIQDLDYYFNKMLMEIRFDRGQIYGNAPSYAELFGYPLFRQVPLTATVLFKKGEVNLKKGDTVILEGQPWKLLETPEFNSVSDYAFAEKVVRISEDRLQIITKREYSYKIGDTVLLTNSTKKAYAVITDIIRTHSYNKYSLENLQAPLNFDPTLCIRLSGIEQISESKVISKNVRSVDMEIINLGKDVSYKPDKGINNAFTRVFINGEKVPYVYNTKETLLCFTERIDREGNTFILVMGNLSYDSTLEVTYFNSQSSLELKKGIYQDSESGLIIENLWDCTTADLLIPESGENYVKVYQVKHFWEFIKANLGNLVKQGNYITKDFDENYMLDILKIFYPVKAVRRPVSSYLITFNDFRYCSYAEFKDCIDPVLYAYCRKSVNLRNGD